MTYISAEPCVGLKDSACVDVCPVDCIYTRDQDDMYYISPDECIDCAACEPVCPVTAIFAEDAVPPEWQEYIEKNYEYFKEGFQHSQGRPLGIEIIKPLKGRPLKVLYRRRRTIILQLTGCAGWARTVSRLHFQKFTQILRLGASHEC